MLPRRLRSILPQSLFRSHRDTHIHTLGKRGEAAAAKYLKKQKYKILHRNFHLPPGEIDILALAPDQTTLVLVEVKASASSYAYHTPPELHINYKKQQKLIALAASVLKNHRYQNRPIRIDIIAVIFEDNSPPIIRHHQSALQASHAYL